MYKQNFRNQAVKEVKNGSTAFSVAKKFDISPGTLSRWVDTYDEKICEITRDEKVPTVPAAPIAQQPIGIQLKSIKVVISGAAVTLGRNDVLKLLSLFDKFEKE